MTHMILSSLYGLRSALRLAAAPALAALLLSPVVLSSQAKAGPSVMVELFTSQGCYSCPPADEVLGQLAKNDNIIALAMHVDYWDYLGWRDTFAQRAFTERQYSYRTSMGARVVYTPQMIVQGVNPVTGSQRMSVKDAIEEALARPVIASLQIFERDQMLVGAITPVADSGPSTLFMAQYTISEAVDIPRGENGGKRLTYHNIVKSLSKMMTWPGASAEEFPLPDPEPGQGVAIWLQQGRTGPVIAAAKFER